MTSNYYWISAPCFAIILVIILIKEFHWFKSHNPLARPFYIMLFFAMVHSLPVSVIDLCISDIFNSRVLFFPMELTSFVTSALLFVFWVNFTFRFIKARPFVFYTTIGLASLIAATGIVLTTINAINMAHQPQPFVLQNVDIWRQTAIWFRDIVYVSVVFMALKRIIRQWAKGEKADVKYVAPFAAALVPLVNNLLFWSDIPVCGLALSTSCLIFYIYIASNERSEMQRSKEIFLENMSHEIRTTLNSVYGFAQLLALPEGTWSAEERQQYTDHIHNSYNMLDMLLNDLMVSTRYDTHSYTVHKEPTNVVASIYEAVNAVKVCVPASVKMSVSSELPDNYTIMSDGRRIRQIVQNLLTNASQYIVKGDIQVSLQQKDHVMRIFIVADMPGTPGKEEEASLTKHKTGMSLRNTISRKIAALLGGTVTRDRSYTKGIKYEVRIKAKVVKQPSVEAADTALIQPTPILQ